jgi:hypothetical protein
MKRRVALKPYVTSSYRHGLMDRRIKSGDDGGG